LTDGYTDVGDEQQSRLTLSSRRRPHGDVGDDVKYRDNESCNYRTKAGAAAATISVCMAFRFLSEKRQTKARERVLLDRYPASSELLSSLDISSYKAEQLLGRQCLWRTKGSLVKSATD